MCIYNLHLTLKKKTKKQNLIYKPHQSFKLISPQVPVRYKLSSSKYISCSGFMTTIMLCVLSHTACQSCKNAISSSAAARYLQVTVKTRDRKQSVKGRDSIHPPWLLITKVMVHLTKSLDYSMFIWLKIMFSEQSVCSPLAQVMM
jgi:hypothetical protein